MRNETDSLAFEKEIHNAALCEREKEWKKRRLDGEDAQALKLRKFKVIMEVLKTKNSVPRSDYRVLLLLSREKY